MKRADEIDTNFDVLNESFYRFLGELGVAVESGLLDSGMWIKFCQLEILCF